MHLSCKLVSECSPGGVTAHERLVVGERVVVEEQARRDVEGDEHVNGVVLVRRQDEEDAEHVHHPREDVQQVQAARRVCGQRTAAWLLRHTQTIYL